MDGSDESLGPGSQDFKGELTDFAIVTHSSRHVFRPRQRYSLRAYQHVVYGMQPRLCRGVH